MIGALTQLGASLNSYKLDILLMRTIAFKLLEDSFNAFRRELVPVMAESFGSARRELGLIQAGFSTDMDNSLQAFRDQF